MATDSDSRRMSDTRSAGARIVFARRTRVCGHVAWRKTRTEGDPQGHACRLVRPQTESQSHRYLWVPHSSERGLFSETATHPGGVFTGIRDERVVTTCLRAEIGRVTSNPGIILRSNV